MIGGRSALLWKPATRGRRRSMLLGRCHGCLSTFPWPRYESSFPVLRRTLVWGGGGGGGGVVRLATLEYHYPSSRMGGRLALLWNPATRGRRRSTLLGRCRGGPMIRWHGGGPKSTKFINLISPTTVAWILQYSGSRVELRDEVSSHR